MPANQPQQGGLPACPTCGNYCIESFGHGNKWFTGCKPCSRRDVEHSHCVGKGKKWAEAKWRKFAAHLAPAEPTVVDGKINMQQINLHGALCALEGYTSENPDTRLRTHYVANLRKAIEPFMAPKPTHSGAELREALEKIASCQSVAVGDVVDIARKALSANHQGPAPTGEEDYAGKLSHLLMYLTDGRLSKPDYDTAMLEAMIDDHVNELVDEEMKRRDAQPPADKPGQMSQVEKSGLKALARLYQITKSEEQLNLLGSLENHIIGQDHLIAALEASHSPSVGPLLLKCHQAIDGLMAALIWKTKDDDKPFFPTQSAYWPTVEELTETMNRMGVHRE